MITFEAPCIADQVEVATTIIISSRSIEAMYLFTDLALLSSTEIILLSVTGGCLIVPYNISGKSKSAPKDAVPLILDNVSHLLSGFPMTLKSLNFWIFDF